MKFEIERKALLKAVDSATSVMERRNTIPILGNLHISASAGAVQIKGTDMDIETVETVAANVSRNGDTTISGSMLLDIVKKMPEGALISIDAEGHNATVKAGRSRFQLGTLPPEDFPAFTRTQYQTDFTIGARALHRLLDKTKLAMSSEESRYHLCGIYLHQFESKLRAVATDGHRLACADVDLPDGAENVAGVIVPRKAVDRMLKILNGAGGEDVTVSISETKIRIATGTVSLSSKVIEGTFPDYTRVIPAPARHVVSVDSGDFSRAIDRVRSVLTDRHNGVKISIVTDGIDLSAGVDGNMAADAVNAAFDGAPVSIGFNSKYMLEILAQIDDLAVISVTGPADQFMIKDADDMGLIFVCMPLRVN